MASSNSWGATSKALWVMPSSSRAFRSIFRGRWKSTDVRVAALQPGQLGAALPGTPLGRHTQHLGVEALRPIEIVGRNANMVDALCLDHHSTSILGVGPQ